MSEQKKIVSKGKVPATEEEKLKLAEQIKSTLLTVNDFNLDGAISIFNKSIVYIPQYKLDVLNWIVDCRLKMRDKFYQTFGQPISKDEFEGDGYGSLKNKTGSRVNYLAQMIARVNEYNSNNEFLTNTCKVEVNRLVEDFNNAINIISLRCKEYYANNNISTYEKSPVKPQLDQYMNVMYDAVRIYNRKFEDYNTMLMQQSLQKNIDQKPTNE